MKSQPTPNPSSAPRARLRPSSFSRRPAIGGGRGLVSLALALATTILGPHGARAADARPNVLFIMSDDHAAHALSAYGSRINTTPQLDRIAQGGMRLDRCFATNSICTPSRAAILTGKYAHRNGVPVFNRFDGTQPTLAKYLQAAGYHTGMFGKWHLGSAPTGFDRWCILPGQGLYHDPVMIEGGELRKFRGYVTDLITDKAIEFLDSRPRDKPFFLCVHHKAPHRNWQPAPRHAKLYDGIDIPEPASFDDDHSGRSRAAIEATMRIGRDLTKSDVKGDPPPGLEGRALKQWKYQRYIKDYLRCVAAVDEGVGRLLDRLDASGLAANTVVIYTSDQGFFLGDHDWYDKRFAYEESIRMPFLIRYPGKIAPGTSTKKMILNVDFAPMILDLAGLPTPPDMQGRSFLPILEGKDPADWRRSMYYRYYHYPQHHRVQPHRAVRTDRYKLIHFQKLDEWELYDLEEDPLEMKNLIAEPSRAALVTELEAELERLRASLGDEDQFAALADEDLEAIPPPASVPMAPAPPELPAPAPTPVPVKPDAVGK